MSSPGKQNHAAALSLGPWSDRIEQDSRLDPFDVSEDLPVAFSKFVPSAFNKLRITRAHWKDGGKCTNVKCGKAFTSKNATKHCYLCGYPYCQSCLQCKRKLGTNAKPSLLGIECPVCERCSQDRGRAQSLGHACSHTEIFLRFRRQSLVQHTQSTASSSVQDLTRSHRGRVIVSQLTHLKKEFEHRRSLLPAMTTGVPDWQKSAQWPHQEDSKRCANCKKDLKIFLLSQKLHCRLCGLIYCSKCAQDKLLLYINSRGVSTWAIVGCNEPPERPKKYVIFPACEVCIGQLQPFAKPPDEGINGSTEGADSKAKDEESEVFYLTITHHQEQAMMHQKTISSSLPRYRELIDEEEEKQQANGVKRQSEIPKELTQLHCDLAKAFKDHQDITMALKGVQGTTHRQKILKQNVMFGCQIFHSNNSMSYRADLTRIQSIMPKVGQADEQVRDTTGQALKMVHIIVLQLVMELFKITDKHPHLSEMLEGDVMVHLKGIEEVVAEELEEVLVESGNTLEQHRKEATGFIRSEMKGNHQKYPSIPPECLYNAPAVKQHILRFSQTHLMECMRHLTSSSGASVRDFRRLRNVIERKLMDFQFMLEFCNL